MNMICINHLGITRRDAMKSGTGAVSLAALGTGAAIPVALSTVSVVATTDAVDKAQQPSRATSQVTMPAMGIVMHPDYARTIAQMAYVWGWPIVNMINRRAAITQAQQPEEFKVSWSFKGTRHFGGHNEVLAPYRTWLMPFFDAIEGPNRHAILSALQEVRSSPLIVVKQ